MKLYSCIGRLESCSFTTLDEELKMSQSAEGLGKEFLASFVRVDFFTFVLTGVILYMTKLCRLNPCIVWLRIYKMTARLIFNWRQLRCTIEFEVCVSFTSSTSAEVTLFQANGQHVQNNQKDFRCVEFLRDIYSNSRFNNSSFVLMEKVNGAICFIGLVNSKASQNLVRFGPCNTLRDVVKW